MNSSRPAPPAAPTYGRIAHVYRWLEYAAFGGALQRSREAFLDRLRDRTAIAVFGAGDGRCFEPLLRSAPLAQVSAFDVDAVMIEIAQKRVARLGAGERVRFIQADARTWIPNENYDAVVTQYFLDCFTSGELDVVIPKIASTLRPRALWLFADFAIPERPRLARLRARVTIALLCRFFQWQVNHPLRSLPPMDEKLHQHGFVCSEQVTRFGGLVRSGVYQRIQ